MSISWQGRMERTWQSLLFPVLPRNHSVQNLQRRARKYFLFSEKFPCSDDFLHSAIWNNVTIVKQKIKSTMPFWRLFLFPCFHLTPNFELEYSGSPSLKWQMWHFVAIRWLGSCSKRWSDSRTQTTPSSWVRSSYKHHKKSGSTKEGRLHQEQRVVPLAKTIAPSASKTRRDAYPCWTFLHFAKQYVKNICVLHLVL